MIHNILIIEDDKEMCEELAFTLRGKGYEVETAYDGMEGNSLISLFTFDIILLDLNLPELSGFDILKNVKTNRTRLSIIVITGQHDAGRMIKGEVDEIIYKPFKTETLISSIEQTLKNRHETETTNAYQ